MGSGAGVILGSEGVGVLVGTCLVGVLVNVDVAIGMVVGVLANVDVSIGVIVGVLGSFVDVADGSSNGVGVAHPIIVQSAIKSGATIQRFADLCISHLPSVYGSLVLFT